MPIWKIKLEVGEIWSRWNTVVLNGGDGTPEWMEIRDEFVKKLESYIPQITSEIDENAANEYQNLVDDIKTNDDSDEFNWSWEEFYDFCDRERIWVEIHQLN